MVMRPLFYTEGDGGTEVTGGPTSLTWKWPCQDLDLLARACALPCEAVLQGTGLSQPHCASLAGSCRVQVFLGALGTGPPPRLR